MNDESKAIEEIAKTTGKAVDAGRELGQFLSKYVGGSFEQAMGIVEDKLKYQRWELQVQLMERANRFLSLRGLSKPTRNVPLHIAIPLFQAGSLEENSLLQERWAALLVNAADASSKTEIRRAFISILEDLTPLDALLLQSIYSFQVLDESAEIWTVHLPEFVTVETPDENKRLPSREVDLSVGNLARLGLVLSAMAWGGPYAHSCVTRTVLGREFLNAISDSNSDACQI